MAIVVLWGVAAVDIRHRQRACRSSKRLSEGHMQAAWTRLAQLAAAVVTCSVTAVTFVATATGPLDSENGAEVSAQTFITATPLATTIPPAPAPIAPENNETNVPAGPDYCHGDEVITFTPAQPRVGSEIWVAVTSSRRHPYGRLAGTERTTFVRERTGQLGYVQEWTVSPTWPGQHAYTFYVDGTVPCKATSIRVREALVTRTPEPASAENSDNGGDNGSSDNTSGVTIVVVTATPLPTSIDTPVSTPTATSVVSLTPTPVRP